MKYEELRKEFGIDDNDMRLVSNGIAVDVIDEMFNRYPLSQYEVVTLVRAVELFEMFS